MANISVANTNAGHPLRSSLAAQDERVVNGAMHSLRDVGDFAVGNASGAAMAGKEAAEEAAEPIDEAAVKQLEEKAEREAKEKAESAAREKFERVADEQSARRRQGNNPPGPTVDPRTGHEVGRFVVDPRGNVMIEPKGGRTTAFPQPGAVDTHTLYPNGSNYQRLNPRGHAGNPTPHGHGHQEGTGGGRRGQGVSIDSSGQPVPSNSPEAHWPLK